MRRNLFDDFAVLFFRFIGDYFRVRGGEVSNSIQKKQNNIVADLVAYDEGLPVVADTNGAGDSFWCGMRCAFFSGESELSVIFYIIFVPVSRIFQDSLLCLVVNIDQTKSFGISLGPFEIIHQGPLEITAYIRNSGGLF